MLERTLTRRTVLEHATTAAVTAGGATGLTVTDRPSDDGDATADPGTAGSDSVEGCDGPRIQPDIAVVGARRRDGEHVVRAGDPVTFDASGTESAARVEGYEWSLGRETIHGERVHHTYERGGGVARVTLTVTVRGGHSASTSVEVGVDRRDRYNESPTAVHDLSPARTYDDGYVVTAGEPVRFDARGSRDPDGDVVGYEWAFRRGEKRGAVVAHAFRRAGNYEVTLSVTDDDGASDSVAIPVHVTW
jgi:hypothetical protein